jgi:hypothetical protein
MARNRRVQERDFRKIEVLGHFSRLGVGVDRRDPDKNDHQMCGVGPPR